MRQAVILAGGLGSRIRYITNDKIPKSLLPIEGVPFLSYQLSLLKNCGFDEVVLCTGYLSNMIEEKYKYDFKGMKLVYSVDPFPNCGTGCALKNAENLLQENFLLMYGDVYLPVKLNKLFDIGKNSLYTMVVAKNDGGYEQSNVTIFNQVTVYYKFLFMPLAEYIDNGIAILNKYVLRSFVPGVESDLSMIMEIISQCKMMSSIVVNLRSYEIGSRKGIERFTNYVKGIKCKQ